MALLIFIVWLVLNGRVTLEICVFGVILSAVLVFFMCRFMDYNIRTEALFLFLLPLLVKYLWTLVKEIVKANIVVLGIILSPDMEPEPALVYFRTDFRTEMSKAILADSITLTPGTITVSVEENLFCVHCLDKVLAEDLDNSVFVKLLHEIEAREAELS